jgi:putative DNA primase/helicase
MAQSQGFYAAAGVPVWANDVIHNDKGATRAIFYNAVVALDQDPALKNAIRHDRFRGQTMLCARVPWDPNPVRIPRPWTDQDDREATNWLQDNGIFVSEHTARNAVQTVAGRNPYHPPMDYFDSITWDGKPRLDTWLATYVGAIDSPYIRAVGARWMISAVARIFQPGCKADCVLVLEGPQGILKSTTFAVLGGPWYTNDIAALGSKDAQEQVIGAWIIELDELDAVTRAVDIALVKAFVSRQTDRFRFSYGHRVSEHPRSCVFGATTNNDTWQRDQTGARRWWPVRCGRIDIDELRTDRTQLWAEAHDRYFNNEPWWLDVPRLVEAAEVEQEERREPDVWEELLVERAKNLPYRNPRDGVGINVLFDLVGVVPERRGRAESVRLGFVLKRIGWEKRRIRIGSRLFWRYFPRE